MTLQAVDSSVEWTYVTYVCASDMGRKQLVTLKMPDDRSYVCTVYLDGVMSQRLEIEGSKEEQ